VRIAVVVAALLVLGGVVGGALAASSLSSKPNVVADHFVISATTSSPVAGANDALTITAEDGTNTKDASYNGDQSLTFSGAGTIGTHNPTVTDRNGTPVSFGTATTITFTNGVSTAGGVMNLVKAESGITIDATDGTGVSSTGSESPLQVTVSPGTASQLAFTTEPSASYTVDDTITTAVTVEDDFGNTVSSSANVSLTLSGGNTTTLGGTIPTAASGGVATFSDLTVFKSGNGYQLTATAPSIATLGAGPFTSTTFDVTHGAADHLKFTAEPSPTYTADSTITVAVTVQDDHNNTVIDGAGSTASVGLTLSGGNTTTLGGTIPSPAVAGVATFSDLTVFKPGTGYQLTAAASGVPTGDTSSSFNVTPGAPDHLLLKATTITPAAGAGDNLTITAQDDHDNTATSYTGAHTLTFSGAGVANGNHPTVVDNTGAAKNFGVATAITFASGQATVSAGANGVMTLFKAETATINATDGTVGTTTGAGTPTPLSVTVGAGIADHLLLQAASTTPSAGATDNLTITAQDASDNTVTSYTGAHTLTFSGAGVANGNHPTVVDNTGAAKNFGVATAITFAGGQATVSAAANGVMTLFKAETATINATDGTVGTTTGAGTPTPLSVTVGSGSVDHLLLKAATTTPAADANDALTITAQDSSDNTVTSYAGDQTLTFSGASTIGTFNPTVTNKNGVATSFGSGTTITFTGGVATRQLNLVKVEGPITIDVTDGTFSTTTGVGTPTPLSVTVGPGTPDHLRLQAATTTPAAAANDALTITAQDASGNTATSYTGNHALTFSGANKAKSNNHPTVTDNTGSAVNFGNATTIAFSSGVATVSAGANGVMNLVKAEGPITIDATDGSVGTTTGTGTTTPLVVTVGAASADHFLLQAATISPTAGASDALTITAEDSNDNTANSYAGDHALTFSGAGTIGTFNPTVTDKNGAATNFGSATTITFTSGVATAGGQMTLVKAQGPITINATNGTISTTTGVGTETPLSVTVTAGASAQVAFTRQPTAAEAGVVISPSPQVTVEDHEGNPALTDTSTVTISITSGTLNQGVLSGTVTGVPGTGPNAAIVTFGNLSIDKVGSLIPATCPAATCYQLNASDGSLVPADSNPFNITTRATSTSVSCNATSQDAGASVTCTATVSDTDPGTETFPAGTVTFTSSGSGGFSPSNKTCTLAQVGTTATSRCSVSYTPASSAGAGSTHTIGGAYTPAPTELVHATSTATGSATFPLLITTSAALSVSVGGPSPVLAGTAAVFTITVSNNGPSDAQSVSEDDSAPGILTGVTGAGSNSLGTIPAGGSASVVLSGTVPSSTPNGTMINDTASASSPTDGGSPRFGTGSVQVTTTPPPPPLPPPPPPPPPPPVVVAPGGGSTGTTVVLQQLSVSVSGAGKVTSSGIACGGTFTKCLGKFKPGTTVKLEAGASKGFDFTGWSGACASAGHASLCSITLKKNADVKATFTPTPGSNVVPVTVGNATFHVTWQGNKGSGDLKVGGSIGAASDVKVELLRIGGHQAVSQKVLSLNKGSFSVTLPLASVLADGKPLLPGGYVVSVGGRSGKLLVPTEVKTVSLAGPVDGILLRSYATSTKNGIPQSSIKGSGGQAYVYFVFASPPASTETLGLTWFNPAGKVLGTATGKPLPVASSSIIVHHASIPKGTYKVELKVGGKVVGTVNVPIT
jgi:hypothetical protein